MNEFALEQRIRATSEAGAAHALPTAPPQRHGPLGLTAGGRGQRREPLSCPPQGCQGCRAPTEAAEHSRTQAAPQPPPRGSAPRCGRGPAPSIRVSPPRGGPATAPCAAAGALRGRGEPHLGRSRSCSRTGPPVRNGGGAGPGAGAAGGGDPCRGSRGLGGLREGGPRGEVTPSAGRR